MKKSFFIAVFLSALISCNVPKNCRLDKTISNNNNNLITGSGDIKLDYELKYNSSDAKNKPSLKLDFKKDGIRISYYIKPPTKVKNCNLKKISKNAFLQLELYKLPIEEQLEIKTALRDTRREISDSKSKAKKLIKSNKKINKLDIIKH
jgi:hypothetical protein